MSGSDFDPGTEYELEKAAHEASCDERERVELLRIIEAQAHEVRHLEALLRDCKTKRDAAIRERDEAIKRRDELIAERNKTHVEHANECARLREDIEAVKRHDCELCPYLGNGDPLVDENAAKAKACDAARARVAVLERALRKAAAYIDCDACPWRDDTSRCQAVTGPCAPHLVDWLLQAAEKEPA